MRLNSRSPSLFGNANVPRTRASEVASRLVGDHIRSSRRELGLTQAELARRLNVSPPYVAKVEAGRANLTVGQLANIAGALGVGLDIRFPLIERRQIELPRR